jgi:hypothetical protein
VTAVGATGNVAQKISNGTDLGKQMKQIIGFIVLDSQR